MFIFLFLTELILEAGNCRILIDPALSAVCKHETNFFEYDVYITQDMYMSCVVHQMWLTAISNKWRIFSPLAILFTSLCTLTLASHNMLQHLV
jgi:hypothetical protein